MDNLLKFRRRRNKVFVDILMFLVFVLSQAFNTRGKEKSVFLKY